MDTSMFGHHSAYRDRLGLGEVREIQNLSDAEIQQLKLEYKDWRQNFAQVQKSSWLETVSKFLVRRAKTPH